MHDTYVFFYFIIEVTKGVEDMKKKIIPIVTISVLGAGMVCSVFPAIAIGHRTFLNGNSVADINAFISTEGNYVCSYSSDSSTYTVLDSHEEVKQFLTTIVLEDDNNYFPYIHRGDTSYVSYAVYHDKYILRLNHEADKCVVEYRSENNYFQAVKHYRFKNNDGQKLVQVIKNVKGEIQ